MTVGNPRKERVMNASRRRKQLIEATIESLARHGLNATTLATVSNEAGLSQGVAVFYFKTKEALLTETLSYLQKEYRDQWQSALAKTEGRALDGIIALVCSDFEASICSRKKLTLWFSFWGEAKARPMYAKISSEFDKERAVEMIRLCEAMSVEMDEYYEPGETAQCLDSLGDGFWLRMHLSPREMDRKRAMFLMLRYLIRIYPQHQMGIETVIAKKGLVKS